MCERSELATVRDSLHENNRNGVCVRDGDRNRRKGERERGGKTHDFHSI